MLSDRWAGAYTVCRIASAQATRGRQLIDNLNGKYYTIKTDDDTSALVWEENNGVKFYEMWGVDYDDPKWDELINNMNNGATNVYYVLILTYIATFGSAVLGIAAVFASFMVTGMRVFDAITDPIIGALMDKSNGRFGKFRPFMIIGSVIMAVSVILLYVLTPFVPANMMWLRYTLFILLYAVWVIGYTFQTSFTRPAQVYDMTKILFVCHGKPLTKADFPCKIKHF